MGKDIWINECCCGSVCVCVCVFGCSECNSVLCGRVFVCLTGQERVIVTVL